MQYENTMQWNENRNKQTNSNAVTVTAIFWTAYSANEKYC